MITSVLLDLDGTLLDTAPDLARALNHTLALHDRPTMSLEEIRPSVSHGAQALVRFGFGIDRDHADFEQYRQELLDYYKSNIAVHTTLFPGMGPVLEELESRNISWGVVTNKPSWLTEPLMEALALTPRAACIVSGDTTAYSKPHPEPLLHACRLTGHDTEECLYLGDATRDIEAGRRAGMRTLAAAFGYLGAEDKPEDWGADGIIHHPAELLDWL